MGNTKAPNSDMEKTKKRVIGDYKKGLKPKELSEKYGVSINTVKSWISRNKSKNPPADPGASSAPAPRKPGAPPGNTNAVGNRGGGAPLGNTNALKHGGYSQIFWDTLTEEEQELIDTMGQDPERMFLDEIYLLTVRERRILQRIEYFQNIKSGMALESVMRSEDKRQFADEEEKQLYKERIDAEVQSGDRLPGHPYRVQNRTEATYNIIHRLEEALSRCQDQKRRAIESLTRLYAETGQSKGSSVADDWVTAVLEADEDGKEE